MCKKILVNKKEMSIRLGIYNANAEHLPNFGEILFSEIFSNIQTFHQNFIYLYFITKLR